MNNFEFKKFVGNKIFSATFTKKDGSLRTYNARVDVKKYTKGGDNPVEHISNYCTIFEMDAGQYRTLNLDTVVSLKCNGEVYASV
tara:strand:+ start:146 stop:400 length:255 start_codon:yes stop_codon:yes gene_type:complete